MNGRKKAVSLRLNVADIKRVKQISQRLGVRDSDVIRYAIKNLLARLSPLSDPQLTGSALVPLFLESGAELVHHFELDAQRLGAVINEGADAGQAVSAEDLHLLAMTGGEEGRAEGAFAHAIGGAATARTEAAAKERRTSPSRRYLYDKYLYRPGRHKSGG